MFSDALAEVYPKCNLQHIVCCSKDRRQDELEAFLDDYMSQNSFDIAISQNYDISLILQRGILKRDFTIP